MGKGSITAQLYTAREALPLSEVSVTFTTPDETQLLAHRITDENGKTPPFELDTPPRESSEAPSASAPYALCNLRIDHPAYYSALIKSISVFDGEESIQYLELIPLPEAVPEDRRGIVYPVTQPNL